MAYLMMITNAFHLLWRLLGGTRYLRVGAAGEACRKMGRPHFYAMIRTIADTARHARELKIATILLLFALLSSATGGPKAAIPDKHLVEVIYFVYVSKAATPRYVEMTLYLSERSRGQVSYDHQWARMGSEEPDSDTKRKATECKKLITALPQPIDLPKISGEMVSVRFADGDKWIVRRFANGHVTIAVRQVLATMGFPNEAYNGLEFASSGF